MQFAQSEGSAVVDGVPVFFAARGEGPCAGGITFRVGMVDESPRWRGVSHLVEHLALAPLAGTSSHHNGETTIDTTGFHVQGSAAEVVEFLGTVCTPLSSLAMQDLDREKSVLRAEAARRSRHVTESLAIYRFGARSYARTSLPEWGLHDLDPDDIQWWAHHYFTRGNAVCWIVADELPADLRLPLPEGSRQPAPPPTSALAQTPAYYAAGSGLIAWSGVVERSTAAAVLGAMLQRDLFRSLRTEAGLSYDVSALYQPRSGGLGDLVLSADALEENQDAALDTFLHGLARLQLGQLSSEDLEAVRQERLEMYGRPGIDRLMLGSRVYDTLVGYPAKSVAELVAELQDLTLDDVTDAGKRTYETGLLRVPAGRDAEDAGFVRAPDTSPTGLDGQSFPAYESPATSMTVGPTGVSWSNGSQYATVPYADCEALILYPDGGRRLVGGDGMNVAVEPTLYEGLGTAIATIDASVSPSAQVRVPRSAEEVPQVDHAGLEQRRQLQRLEHQRKPAVRVATAILTVLFVLGWIVIGLLGITAGALLADGDSDGWAALVCTLGFIGLLIFGHVRFHRARHGRPVSRRLRS